MLQEMKNMVFVSIKLIKLARKNCLMVRFKTALTLLKRSKSKNETVHIAQSHFKVR